LETGATGSTGVLDFGSPDEVIVVLGGVFLPFELLLFFFLFFFAWRLASLRFFACSLTLSIFSFFASLGLLLALLPLFEAEAELELPFFTFLLFFFSLSGLYSSRR